jgi:probable addiction module antidote protein
VSRILLVDCSEKQINMPGHHRNATQIVSKLSAELAASRLDAHFKANDLTSFLQQLSSVIRACGGYTAAARAAGINRTGLYKMVSPQGNPELNTIVAVLTALGLRLSIQPTEQTDNPANIPVVRDELDAGGPSECRQPEG